MKSNGKTAPYEPQSIPLRRRSDVTKVRCRVATACRSENFRLEALQFPFRCPCPLHSRAPQIAHHQLPTGTDKPFPLAAEHAPNPHP